MTIHTMRLHPTPFEMIRIGKKTVEIRLNDEKRKLMRIGDYIEFTLRTNEHEKIKREIIGLDLFQSFKDAYEQYAPEEYGGDTKNDWELMYKYYSKAEEKDNGVLGIRLKSVG